MHFILTAILLILFYLAILLIRTGIHTQQKVYHIDPYRSESFLDLLQRKTKRILDNLHRSKLSQAAVYTTIAALMMTSTIIIPNTESIAQDYEDTQGMTVANNTAKIKQGTATGYVELENNEERIENNEVDNKEEENQEEKVVEENKDKISTEKEQDIVKTREEVEETTTKKDSTEKEKEEETETEENVEEDEPESDNWVSIPLCDTVSPSKTYMGYQKITARPTQQWKMFREEKWGVVEIDDLGFCYILGEDPDTEEDMKFYTVALSTYYQNHVGQKFRITMDSGFTFGAIIGDIKSDAHTNPGSESANLVENPPKIEGITLGDPNRCVAGSNDMLEFVVDEEKLYNNFPAKNGYANSGSMNADFDAEHMFKGHIIKIEVLKDS